VYDSGKHLGLLLDRHEMSFLREYTRTLDILDELTKGMSAQKYVTASAVLPVVYLLSHMWKKALDDAPAPVASDEEMPDGEHEPDEAGDLTNQVNFHFIKKIRRVLHIFN